MRRRRWLLVMAAAVASGLTNIDPAPAQTYPSHTVRIVVPFGAGSLTDILARMIAEDATKKWGQQVIVENRPGPPGTIAVSRADPDGLTLMLTSNGHAAVGYINKNLGFDPVKDFAGITRVATIPMYLIVHPGVPAKTVSELISLTKSKPGTLNFASPGLGSGGFIAAALFKKLTGIDIVHIPYKGHPEAMTAMMRGDRARAAWAHDTWSDPNITASFLALPGTSFTVTGAVPATDLLLASASSDMSLGNGYSFGLRFDGEFAEHSQKYAGAGRLRYTW